MKPAAPSTSSATPPLVTNRAGALTAAFLQEAKWLERALRSRFGIRGAEDIVQETYLRVAGHTEVRNPRALLLRVALNIARDQLRRTIVRERHVTHASAFGHSSLADQAETLLLKQVVLSLPAADREIFILSRFGGLTYDEISAHSKLSIKTVEWRMSRALAHCAKLLRDSD